MQHRLAKQSGFTLVELVVVVVILAIVGVVAIGKFEDLSDDAEHAKVDMIYATVETSLHKYNTIHYALEGKPDNSSFVPVYGVNTRFFNGHVRNMQTFAHVPPGTPNRGNQATRFWFLMFEAPPPVIARTDVTNTGWAMYNGPAGCGIGSSRCWRYRRAGTELAVITYRWNVDTLTLVKNF